MEKENWTRWDYLTALLIAMIVVGDMLLAITVIEVDAETPRVEAVMSEAQERIDNYLATLPAEDKPVVISVAPEETESPRHSVALPPLTRGAEDWYIADVPLAPELQKALWDACREFEIDYPLALAVIEQETRFQNLIGDSGESIGYFQIQPYWWSDMMERIGADDLTDPAQNFRTGCAILRELLLRYDGSVTDALTAYNSGHPGQSAYAEAVMAAAWVE